MYKIPDEVIKFIENTMEIWRVVLTAGGIWLRKMRHDRYDNNTGQKESNNQIKRKSERWEKRKPRNNWEY